VTQLAERRRRPRLGLDERLFIQVLACDADPSLTNTTTRCRTRDASENGLCLQAERPIEPGCLLSLWVKVGARPGTFLMTGKSRWFRPDEDGGAYLVGVEIYPVEQEDTAAWRQMIAGC